MSRGALVVVADRARARLFSWTRAAEALQELGDWANPEARLPCHVLAADRQGRSLNRQRGSRTALGDDAQRRNSTLRFARQVSARLRAELRAQHAVRLFIFAEAEFLGLLRKDLRSRGLAVPAELHAKNLTRAAPQRIREYLPKYPGRIIAK